MILFSEFAQNEKPKGAGSCGSIFTIISIFAIPENSKNISRGMKTIKVPNYYDKEHKDFQNSLITEIDILSFIKTISNYNLFFVEYFFCVDISEKFKELEKLETFKDINEDLQNIITINKIYKIDV